MRISAEKLAEVLKRDAKAIEAALTRAIQETAQRAVVPIRKRVPVAFGELRDSVAPMDIGSHPKTCVDAPHAGAVEQGSMPHTPDWEALLRWVRLRGMQGLSEDGHIRRSFSRSEGPTTPLQAQRIAQSLKKHEIRGRNGVGRHSPIDAAIQVAEAISRTIQKEGTKPHWYVRSSLPDIRNILDSEVKNQLAVVSHHRA